MTELLIAGSELDALIAEKIMGDGHGDYGTDGLGRRAFRWKHNGELMEEPPPYSTDVAAAWEVVVAMRDRYNYLLKLEQFLMNSDAYEDWHATFIHRETDFEVESMVGLFQGQSAPLAICRAALKAVGA